jgi:competence protein ComEC
VRFLGELRAREAQPAFLPERRRWRALAARQPLEVRMPSALSLEVLGPARPGPLLRLAAGARARFEALGLSGPARDLWGALTLAIPPVRPETLTPFAESGTIHVLVVSGLQVTLVMGALAALYRPLGGWIGTRLARSRGMAAGSGGMPAWARGLATLSGSAAAWAGGLLYAAAAGCTAPVWRGLAMGCAWSAGRASGWQLPRALTLHAALLAWLMTHPGAGCEPGFLLAWLALTGLLGAAEPLAGLLSGPLGRAAAPVARVLAPWLTTFPLLALLHGGVPLWGPAANLLLLPLVAVLVPLCLALTLFPAPFLVAAVARLLAWCGGVLAPACARVTPLATGILWPWLALPLGWILLAQLHAGFRRTRALCAALAGASALLLAFRGTGRGARALSVEAIDVGQGDALLVRVPGGPATLLDTGPDPQAARRIVRVLSRRGVREPLRLLLTHPHQDHAGGWATLARLWPPAATAVPALADGGEAWAAYAPPGWTAYQSNPGAAGPGAPGLRRGDAWNAGAARFSVRWPPGPLRVRDANSASLVLRLDWQDRECWLMGDALAAQERDLLDLGDPGPAAGARLLKAGHHGSRGASDPAWIAALDPDLALVSAGRDNRFEHPHAEAMAALRSRGARVYVTGTRQGLWVRADGPGWRVEAGDGTCFRFPARR